MSDDERLGQSGQIVVQGNIFEPRISGDQRRLAVRYDALRSAMGKGGRTFKRQSALLLPSPVLHLEPDPAWYQRRKDGEVRLALLEFRAAVPRARTVTLWDAAGKFVDSCTFRFGERTEVTDPGPGASVELRDDHGITFLVGVPERVFDPQVQLSATTTTKTSSTTSSSSTRTTKE